LEDIDEKGEAKYITEGMLRLIHRNAFDANHIHEDVVPLRSYLKVQANEMPVNKEEKVQFDLLPTSYLLKKGHSLRLSFSGADKAYFKASIEKNASWKVHHSSEFPSRLILPAAKVDS
jgi:predicted acyl esterase